MNTSIFRTLVTRARSDIWFITPLLSFLIADKVGIDFEWWYFVAGGSVFIGHMIWSHKRGVRQEIDYSFQQSKEFQELKNMVKKLLEGKDDCNGL